MVSGLRFLVLAVPLLVGASFDATPQVTAEPTPAHERAMSVVQLAAVQPTKSEPSPTAKTVTPRPRTDFSSTVYWTVEQEEPFEMVASRFGLTFNALSSLNPKLELGREDKVAAGTRLVVYRPDPERPTLSVGSPNKGRLQHGMPMPEGEAWLLRDRRTRHYGATNTIRALVQAFDTFSATYADAPPVSVGEISSPHGGKALPHRSHRTGRDVDLGYILTAPGEGPHWKRADEGNFDAEKNWALIKALVDTGEVQNIFISSKLQRLLRPVAAEQLSEEEFARYFRVPGGDPKAVPILRHEDGHRDHMHVRFRCEPGNYRCRSLSSASI